MRIELLYFDGCPSYETLLPKVRELLAREGVQGEIEVRPVESLEAAEEALPRFSHGARRREGHRSWCWRSQRLWLEVPPLPLR